MTVSVIRQLSPNCVKIHLSSEVRSKINGNEVVVEEIDGLLMIREPIITDNKRLKINKTNNLVTYTSGTANDYLGKWNVEIEGDYFVLDNEEK